MVYVTSGIRWAIGVWLALAVGLVGWAVAGGAKPSSVAMLLVACAAPLGLVSTLVGFRSEPRTAAQVLHDRDGAGR